MATTSLRVKRATTSGSAALARMTLTAAKVTMTCPAATTTPSLTAARISTRRSMPDQFLISRGPKRAATNSMSPT